RRALHLWPVGCAQSRSIRKRAQRATSRRRLIRRVALSHSVERPIEAQRLPLTLRAYRTLLTAAAPLAGMLLAQRLKRGKEDPERILERRGETTVARPTGPL